MVYLLQVGLIFDKPILNLYLIFSVIELNLFSSLFYPFLWYLDSVFSGPLVPWPCIFWSFGNWTLFPGHISTWILFSSLFEMDSILWIFSICNFFYSFPFWSFSIRFCTLFSAIFCLQPIFWSFLSEPYFLVFFLCTLFSGIFNLGFTTWPYFWYFFLPSSLSLPNPIFWYTFYLHPFFWSFSYWLSNNLYRTL